MELVRYRAGEAIRWLQSGADVSRKNANTHGKQLSRTDLTDKRSIGSGLKEAVGAVTDLGRGAYADLMHRQADASEYVLQETQLDIVKGKSIKSVPYERVKKIEYKGEKATFVLDKGSITIKPFAYIVAGHMKVPVGWSRNGMEVPYEVLIEELAARCNLEIDEEA